MISLDGPANIHDASRKLSKNEFALVLSLKNVFLLMQMEIFTLVKE